METTPNDLSRKKSKTRLMIQEGSSGFRPNAENSLSGSSNKPERRKRYLEEVEKERNMKELEQNQQNDAHLNFIGRQKALKKDGKNQTNSNENDLESTLQSYEKNHPSVYLYLSETAKIIRSLQNSLACGQLATEGVSSKADTLNQISSVIPDEARGAIVVDFLVDVAVPELLTEVIRSLYQKYPNVFSSERQKSSEVQWALEVLISIFDVISGFTDLHDKFCEACGEAGMVEECLKLLRGLKMCTHELSDIWCIREGKEGTLGFRVLVVLHNLSKSINKKYFDSCGAVETLVSFYETQFPTHRMTALLCLAYLVDEENNHLIKATKEPIKDLLKLLEEACNSDDRRCQGFSVTGIVVGLSYFVRNDRNKRMIGQLGGIPLLVALLEDKLCLLEVTAIRTLYMLSLDEENKAIMKANDHKGELKIFYNSSDEGIQQAASGMIWEIEGKKEHNSKSSDSEEHIMISYHWKYQKEMREVKTELESKGLRVWMDEDKMNGDTLETMARAVEKSSVILMAMSRQYQRSPSCRSEAAYAYKLGKKIIPLMMEENYTPDGWLGLILARKPYMHFEKDPQEGIQQLLKEITNLTAAVSAQSEVLSTSSPMQEANKRVSSWQKEDVAKWLESIGLDVGDNEVRGNLDGSALCKLDDLRKESPEFFYSSVKTDLALSNVIDVMKFTEELKQLLN
ncbi:PREDICTED: uncharacterized protein LOC107333164 isoform X2 [Acropora digitifera]|uniref:uncharacterized protein LOC107333164 isoform X2 n=1 Tax=Acropora digitifera TaxID=70779 RepID=UPI00077A9160|nr:PREDICTED: uncharacterized protein LOC107333164 isoform X2 [Acropora digitifera]